MRQSAKYTVGLLAEMSAKNSKGVKIIRNMSAKNSEGCLLGCLLIFPVFENGLNVTVETRNDIKRNMGPRKSLVQWSTPFCLLNE